MRDRRRRLLSEDTAVSAAAPVVRVSDAANRKQLYSDAARAARGRGLHALVPLRGWVLLLWGLCLLGGVGGLLGLHFLAERVEPMLGKGAVHSLRLDAPGALSAWLSAAMLAAATGLALFIYSLRRHRIDDYHGRYRCWLLVALACAVANLFEGTSLASLAKSLCDQGCAAAGVRAEVVWPAGIAGAVSGVLLRLAIEVRRARGALATLLLSAVGFSGAVASHFGWPIERSALTLPLWERGSWLLGYALLLVSLLLYSRRVQFDVAGLGVLPARAKRKKAAPSADDSAAERPTPKTKLKLRTDLDPIEPAADDDTSPDGSKLVLGASDKAPASSASRQSAAGSKRLSRAERHKSRQQEQRLAS